MGPNDGSDNSRQPGSADSNSLEGVTATGAGTVVFNANPEVRDRGQIAEMALPQGWVEAPPVQFSGGVGMKSRRVIHPPEAPRVRLCFFYRGLPMNQAASRQFFNVLQMPAHNLSESEFNSLGVLLRDRDDPAEFTLFTARTEDWNGRRVLVVEGRYHDLQEDCLGIFIDAAGDGRLVQEVFYQAPKDLYKEYGRAAEDALRSIRWRSESNEEIKPAASPKQELSEDGPIAEINLPEGWVEGPPHKFAGGIGKRFLREVYPPEAPTARLALFYRELPLNESNAKTFHEILQKPAHVLTQANWRALGELLADKANPEEFKPFMTRTEDLNGKRVLTVEGRYSAIVEDVSEIFVDALGDGSLVYQIAYMAPKELYIKYLRAAKAVMKSVRWK